MTRQAPITRNAMEVFTTASGSGGGGGITSAAHYESVAAVGAASIDDAVDFIETQGYYAAGDGGAAQYVRRGAEPTLPGKLQSINGTWWEIVAPEFNVRAFGATGDGVTDDAWAIQDALDRGIGLYNAGKGSQKILLPPGRYKISVPLEIFAYIGPEFGYTTVTLCGDASSGYAAPISTTLAPTFNNLPAIFVQKARNVRIAGFAIQGNANNGVGVSYAALIDDNVSPWWNALGARDDPYSPHCAIAIDAFNVSRPTLASGSRYPGYDAYYTSAGGGGSRSVMIENMLFTSFIVAVGCSLSGTQLGDSITVRDNTFTCNKVCVVIGQSQARGVLIHNNHAQFCQVYVDSKRYGDGGAPGGTISAGTVDYCKWLIIAAAGIDSATIRDLYVESLWSIGMWGWASSGHTLLVERCHIKLIKAVVDPGGAGMHAIDAHLHNESPVAFYGGYIGFNDNFPHRFSIRNTAPVSFDGNIMLDGMPQCADETLVEFKSVRLRFSTQGPSFGMSREYNQLLGTIGQYDVKAPPGCTVIDGTTGRRWRSATGWREVIIESAPVAFTVPGDGTATFTSAANYLMLRVGDELTTLSTWNGENPLPGVLTDQNYRKTLIGKVTAIDSGTGLVSLFQVPKSFAAGSYSVWLIELPTIRPITVGTTTSGSAVVATVSTMNGATTAGWVAGDHIQGVGIPTGARVIAVDNGARTITMSHNATASGTVQLYDAQLVLEEGSAAAVPSTAVAWGRGTFLKNSGLTVKDGNNMVLRGWVCTASGAPGTWEPQYTSAISPAT